MAGEGSWKRERDRAGRGTSHWGHFNFQILPSQIWTLLPGFCTRPTDVAASFKGLARTLGTAINERPDLRVTVCQALRTLITKGCEAGKRGSWLEDAWGAGLLRLTLLDGCLHRYRHCCCCDSEANTSPYLMLFPEVGWWLLWIAQSASKLRGSCSLCPTLSLSWQKVHPVTS